MPSGFYPIIKWFLSHNQNLMYAAIEWLSLCCYPVVVQTSHTTWEEQVKYTKRTCPRTPGLVQGPTELCVWELRGNWQGTEKKAIKQQSQNTGRDRSSNGGKKTDYLSQTWTISSCYCTLTKYTCILISLNFINISVYL